MMATGSTLFTALVWANVALVLVVFAYEIYVVASELRTVTG